jgi:hypothetical protein
MSCLRKTALPITKLIIERRERMVKGKVLYFFGDVCISEKE